MGQKTMFFWKKEGASTLHNSMDGSGEHYAKWSKPGGERQIPHDLTYKQNLINKTNWQAKYSQRHWNRQWTDSNQRGGEREIMWERRERNVNEHEWGTHGYMHPYAHCSIMHGGQDMETISVLWQRTGYTMEHSSAIRKDAMLSFVSIWINIETSRYAK